MQLGLGCLVANLDCYSVDGPQVDLGAWAKLRQGGVIDAIADHVQRAVPRNGRPAGTCGVAGQHIGRALRLLTFLWHSVIVLPWLSQPLILNGFKSDWCLRTVLTIPPVKGWLYTAFWL